MFASSNVKTQLDRKFGIASHLYKLTNYRFGGCVPVQAATANTTVPTPAAAAIADADAAKIKRSAKFIFA